MTVLQLPEGYTLIRDVDLMKHKKLAVFINVLAVVIELVMVAVGVILFPIEGLLDINMLMNCAIVIVGIVLYLFAHELTHCVFMKLFCPKAKLKIGFTGVYAYAGAPHVYFGRAEYIIIALAPVVILGILLAVLNVLLFPAYFWGIYFIQVVNISGAAGDYYVTFLMLARMPKDTLVCDTGVSMTMYSSVGGTRILTDDIHIPVEKVTLDEPDSDAPDDTNGDGQDSKDD